MEAVRAISLKQATRLDGDSGRYSIRLLRMKDGEPLFNFWANLSCRRPEPGPAGAPAPPVVSEWVRLEPEHSFDEPFLNAARPLILLDTFGWPAVWQRYRRSDYVAPNLDTAGGSAQLLCIPI
jgi:hypothetical protein